MRWFNYLLSYKRIWSICSFVFYSSSHPIGDLRPFIVWGSYTTVIGPIFLFGALVLRSAVSRPIHRNIYTGTLRTTLTLAKEAILDHNLCTQLWTRRFKKTPFAYRPAATSSFVNIILLPGWYTNELKLGAGKSQQMLLVSIENLFLNKIKIGAVNWLQMNPTLWAQKCEFRLGTGACWQRRQWKGRWASSESRISGLTKLLVNNF